MVLHSCDFVDNQPSSQRLENDPFQRRVHYLKRIAFSGQARGFLLFVLDCAGAENSSLLNGGVASWKRAGYELSDEGPDYGEKTFEVDICKDLLLDNEVEVGKANPLPPM